jgi:hypothetical protein
MKAIRRYGENLTIEIEGRDVKELWSQLSATDEAFSSLTCAAKINDKVVTSNDVSFRKREVDGNDYYEVVVASGPLRGFIKRFGQHKNQKTLFPKDENPSAEEAATSLSHGWRINNGFRGWFRRERNLG